MTETFAGQAFSTGQKTNPTAAECPASSQWFSSPFPKSMAYQRYCSIYDSSAKLPLEMPWSHEMNILECCDCHVVNLLTGKYSRMMVFVASRTNISPAWQPMGLSDLEHGLSSSDSTLMGMTNQSRSWEYASCGGEI